jgi:hypothetical protein
MASSWPGQVWRRYFKHQQTPLLPPPPVSPSAVAAQVSPGQTWRRYFKHRQTPLIPPSSVITSPAGSQPNGLVIRRVFIRSITGGITAHAQYNGSQPGGVVYRRRPARAVVGNSGQSGDGFSSTAFPNGKLPPGGIAVKRRLPARAVVGNNVQPGDGFAGRAFYNGQLPPGGVAVKRRSAARAVVGNRSQPGGGFSPPLIVTTTGPPGSQPGGIVRRRFAARAVTAHAAGQAFYNGSPAGGVVYRRRPARAVTGSILGPPAPQLSTTSGLIVRMRPVRAIWAGITSTAQYNGSIQPRAAVVPQRNPLQRARAVSARVIGRAFYNGTPPSGVVYRRKSARALVGNNLQPGDGFAGRAFYNGSQPGGVVYRRRPARAVWAGNAVPGRRGTPATGASVTRRHSARAVTASIAGQAFYNGSPTGGVVYRRRPARAVTANVRASAFYNGQVPPRSGVVVAQRLESQRSRAVSAFIAAQVQQVYGPAGTIPPHPSVSRRTSARAFWQGTVVRTVNASGGSGHAPGGVVYRRGPARAVTAHVAGRAFYNGSAPGGVVYRRRPARAVTGSIIGAPAPQLTASGALVIRLRPVRAVWAGITATAYPNGSIQPHPAVQQRSAFQRPRAVTQHITGRAFYNGSQPGGVVYRRKPSRAFVAFTHGLGTFPPPSGTIQPRATIPVPRRSSARAVWASVRGKASAAVAVSAPRQLLFPPRRTSARAFWAGVRVRTTNAPPVAVSAPKFRASIPRRYPSRVFWAGTISSTVNAIPIGLLPSQVTITAAGPTAATRQVSAATLQIVNIFAPTQSIAIQTGVNMSVTIAQLDPSVVVQSPHTVLVVISPVGASNTSMTITPASDVTSITVTQPPVTASGFAYAP